MSWTVYILKCADGTLYTGITNNLPQRLEQHENGTGAKYTRGRGPFKMIYSENHPTRSTASKREANIKKMSRAEKYKIVIPASEPAKQAQRRRGSSAKRVARKARRT